ncbi:MAG: hypothetical protein IPF99_24115 [Deltaproteobacteria bacterium]|nr:hypothetical protein [Deltaproteobacteria bacterium]
MDETAAQRQRVGAVLLGVMVVAAAALAWPRARRGTPVAEATPRAVGPRSAGAMVPREARGVLRMDVAAMRRSSAYGGWFEAVRSSDDPCARALGERVTGLVVVWTSTALDDFTLLADGPVDEATFRRCSGTRRGRALDVQQRIEAGVPVLALSERAAGDGGAGRSTRAETWRLPSGVVALGPPEALRAMLVEARAHPDATAVTPDLAGLWTEVPEGALAAGVRRLSHDEATDPALARARTVSAWISAEGGATVLSATVRCDDAAAATAVAAALGGLRRVVRDFRALPDEDRVRVRATLDPAALARAISPR